MPDKGIQIIVALLEKRESFCITKDSNDTLVQELLRAERLGYAQKEEKSGKYTLSEMGRRLVYSNYGQEADFMEDKTPVIHMPAPEMAPKLSIAHSPAIVNKADLRPAYAATFLITASFLITVLVIWFLDLA